MQAENKRGKIKGKIGKIDLKGEKMKRRKGKEDI